MAAPQPTGKYCPRIALYPRARFLLSSLSCPGVPHLVLDTCFLFPCLHSFREAAADPGPFPKHCHPQLSHTCTHTHPGHSRQAGPSRRTTFTAAPHITPEDTVLLLDEVPAQDDVLPPLGILPAHSAGKTVLAKLSPG